MPALSATGGAEKLGGWSVVSLDGEALDFDGTLRGGSSESDGAASVLKRKRAIADLQTQAAESEATFQTIEKAALDARQARMRHGPACKRSSRAPSRRNRSRGARIGTSTR